MLFGEIEMYVADESYLFICRDPPVKIIIPVTYIINLIVFAILYRYVERGDTRNWLTVPSIFGISHFYYAEKLKANTFWAINHLFVSFLRLFLFF